MLLLLTVLIFKVGKYQGSRTIEDLINYLSEMAMLTNNNENTQNVEIDDSPV